MVGEKSTESEADALPVECFKAVRQLVDAGKTPDEIEGLVRLFHGLRKVGRGFRDLEELIRRIKRVAIVAEGDVVHRRKQSELRKRIRKLTK